MFELVTILIALLGWLFPSPIRSLIRRNKKKSFFYGTKIVQPVMRVAVSAVFARRELWFPSQVICSGLPPFYTPLSAHCLANAVFPHP